MQVDKMFNSSTAQRKHDEEILTIDCFFHIRLVLDVLKDLETVYLLAGYPLIIKCCVLSDHRYLNSAESYLATAFTGAVYAAAC